MMKRFILLFVVAMAMISCSQQNTQQNEAVIEEYQISALVSDPMAFENQVVRLEGVISHICRHSGDKMRVVQVDDDAYSIQVMLGDLKSQFNPEMEGKHVELVGTLKVQLMNLASLEEEHDHEHEGEEEGHGCSSTEEAIRKLQEKGISPDLRANVELINVEVK